MTVSLILNYFQDVLGFYLEHDWLFESNLAPLSRFQRMLLSYRHSRHAAAAVDFVSGDKVADLFLSVLT